MSRNWVANFDEAKDNSVLDQALNRIGEPRELAATILFLASGESSFVTGVALPADGGCLATALSRPRGSVPGSSRS
ncbi:NAD(P)-dependent dehydrogenase (short-subunit alcohol dehydrogenase family) [Amycolatopsis thermophila]|uniref:NAD(P)-dependent dehydrogenase (Short-subunit alcohol dehydrogenase family) n=1 Tax=Amycolatopsis thermophila TaxID=206084 RepID=A0ABU0F5C6_9PSEU|nr:NAD(P)-dependent dehydrogenase (short-subunit alcohol dehydrogenase family) [Amycolatopsis thermophila]